MTLNIIFGVAFGSQLSMLFSTSKETLIQVNDWSCIRMLYMIKDSDCNNTIRNQFFVPWKTSSE
jgi:hypothetical protein